MMFFFSSRRRHTRFDCDWSSDVCSSDLGRSTGLTRRRTYPTGAACGTCRSRSRSEEHTSELQSQSNLVCRLLLEKKKNNVITHDDYYHVMLRVRHTRNAVADDDSVQVHP